MKHLFSTKVKVVLVIALLLAAALTVVNSLTGLSLGEMTVQYVLTPLRTGASKLTDQAEQMYSYIFRYETLSAENEKLQQQLAEMEDVARGKHLTPFIALFPEAQGLEHCRDPGDPRFSPLLEEGQ